MLRLFQYLPIELLDAIRESITAVGVLVADAQRHAPTAALDLLSSGPGENPADEGAPWLCVADIEDEEDFLYEEAPFAVMRHSYSPAVATAAGGPLRDGGAALRRTETLVNGPCGELFGMHAEELLARVGGHDLPEQLCELDHLLLILENLFYCAPQVCSFVQRYRVQLPGGRIPSLITY